MQRLCESGKHGKMAQDSEHPVCLLDNSILEAYLRQAGSLCKSCYFREIGMKMMMMVVVVVVMVMVMVMMMMTTTSLVINGY
jgi:hypothetical protein